MVSAPDHAASLQTLGAADLAELLARVYFESGVSKPYLARPAAALPADEGWAQVKDAVA